MDPLDDRCFVIAFACWVMTLLLDANQTFLAAQAEEEGEEVLLSFSLHPDFVDAALLDTFSLFTNAVNNYRLCCPPIALSDEVSFWVKPPSTTWFCRFLVDQYDNSRWLSMFRMTKTAVFALADLLRPQIEKKNTRYRLAVPAVVRVACTLFKLTHGANLTICSEMFAIGRSTCCKVLREVVRAINDTLKVELTWPTPERAAYIRSKFADLCSLPGIVGAIDGVQIPIAKPDFGAADYYYFKSGGYSMNSQAVVDSEKRFLDLYVGVPGSTNDSRMLRRSSLFQMATHENLLRSDITFNGQSSYLIGDQGYPLLPWLMVPHRDRQQLSISERLFNRKLRKGRTIVENAFGILKQSFRKLLGKSDLHLTFLPDVVVCCAILHNLLLKQSHVEVEELLQLLHREGLTTATEDDFDDDDDDQGLVDERRAEPVFACDDARLRAARLKRAELGVLLTTRRAALMP